VSLSTILETAKLILRIWKEKHNISKIL
jgi:hypothetical protein